MTAQQLPVLGARKRIAEMKPSASFDMAPTIAGK